VAGARTDNPPGREGVAPLGPPLTASGVAAVCDEGECAVLYPEKKQCADVGKDDSAVE
jgi:hypothetical protein